jgi:PAS domain S-box-containing protein
VAPDLHTPRASAPSVWESEEIYHLLVQSVVDYAIFLLDRDGRIRTWNQGAERLKGYSSEEIVGQHFSVFYTEKDRADRYPEYELLVASRKGTFEDEGWRIRKDGGRFWANVVITALERDGELVGFAKVTRDLTERKQTEEVRERLLARERAAREEAETANRAKVEFLSAMSHELRTPLNAIAGYVQLLAMKVHGPVTEAQQGVLKRIRHNQEHLLTLINDLLHFTKIQKGTLEVRQVEVSIAEVFQNLEDSILPQVEQHGLTFSVEPVDAELRVLGDRARFEQILINLVSNALKFTDREGRIRVWAEPVNDALHLRVADTGRGISPEKLENIFDPFVQVRDSQVRDPSRQGVGLGLAISRELARAMGGDLAVRSRVGEGSTFTLTIPLAPAGT